MYTHTLFHLIYLKLAFRQWECFLFSLSSTDLVANVTKENQWILRFRNAGKIYRRGGSTRVTLDR